MKTIKYYSYLLLMLIASINLVGCSSDDETEEVADYASQVAGVYTGKLMLDNYVIEDAYVVNVTRVSSTVVTVRAEFYEKGSANYNVELFNGQFLFRSESSSGITISVTGKNMTINFLNDAGTMTTFTGKRD